MTATPVHAIFTDMAHYSKTTSLLFLLALVPVLTQGAQDNNISTKNTQPAAFEQSEKAPKEKMGNILNIILGTTPGLSTKRGTLEIIAFVDGNGNKRWDVDELELKGKISCTLNDIHYSIPAFIPALDYNARYKISCVGSRHFQPTIEQKNVLIAHRGQIITMKIPCSKTNQ